MNRLEKRLLTILLKLHASMGMPTPDTATDAILKHGLCQTRHACATLIRNGL